MNLSFKNRIALYYMLATASIIALVFVIIYFGVRDAAYDSVDRDLTFEAYKHSAEIYIEGDSFAFINKDEWLEMEHRRVQVYPVFVQLVDLEGNIMDKSPNLKEDSLVFMHHKGLGAEFDTKLSDRPVRQMQIPIEQNGDRKGYILTAMSLDGPILVLKNLWQNLLWLFPLVLMGLFVITRFLAGRSIQPVRTITYAADRITRESLNERIPLPANQDELYTLTSSINELLDRMQKAIEREEQFTADASHQMRTPLAVLKGTLEVLVRKSRTEQEYRDKIHYSIQEIDRISDILNQLLVLARMDTQDQNRQMEPVNLQVMVDEILFRFRTFIKEKNLTIHIEATDESTVMTDPYYADLILENLISNAIKYAHADTVIKIKMSEHNGKFHFQIRDHGIVILPTDISHVFNPFYRANPHGNKEMKGSGLGLSIVKKASDLLDIEVGVESDADSGTSFNLVFSHA